MPRLPWRAIRRLFVPLCLFVSLMTFMLLISPDGRGRRTGQFSRYSIEPEQFNQRNGRSNITVQMTQASVILGPGEKGKPLSVIRESLSAEEVKEMDKLYEEHGFNAFISDMISVHRKSEDRRPQVCKSLRYPDNLPPASVVVPFRDEYLSVLLRTIYSIMEGTRAHLLQELILVDDGSTSASLQSRLQVHVQSLPKVKLIRLKKTQGLMTARQTGINAAVADIVIVMDSHMEVMPGWLEPLISRLQENPRALLCSNIGSIDRKDFSVTFGFVGRYQSMAFFTAQLDQSGAEFNEDYINSRNNTTDPLKFASISGMMIAVNKAFFQKLGGFDQSMRVWGSEQIELSIKYWTCGGVVEVIPCSFVAHLFRERVIWISKSSNYNKLRVAMVWMDDYKQMLFDYSPSIEQLDPGDIEDRRRIRRENNCKPFQYYLDEMRKIANFHLPYNRRTKWPLKIKATSRDMCLDAGGKSKEPILYMCHGGTNQFFELSDAFRIRHYEDCLRLVADKKVPLQFERCRLRKNDNDDHWEYKQDDTVVHTESGKCLTAELVTLSVSLRPCDGSEEQQWVWNRLRQSYNT